MYQLRLLDDHVGGEETFALVTSEVAATADLARPDDPGWPGAMKARCWRY